MRRSRSCNSYLSSSKDSTEPPAASTACPPLEPVPSPRQLLNMQMQQQELKPKKESYKQRKADHDCRIPRHAELSLHAGTLEQLTINQSRARSVLPPLTNPVISATSATVLISAPNQEYLQVAPNCAGSVDTQLRQGLRTGAGAGSLQQRGLCMGGHGVTTPGASDAWGEGAAPPAPAPSFRNPSAKKFAGESERKTQGKAFDQDQGQNQGQNQNQNQKQNQGQNQGQGVGLRPHPSPHHCMGDTHSLAPSSAPRLTRWQQPSLDSVLLPCCPKNLHDARLTCKQRKARPQHKSSMGCRPLLGHFPQALTLYLHHGPGMESEFPLEPQGNNKSSEIESNSNPVRVYSSSSLYSSQSCLAKSFCISTTTSATVPSTTKTSSIPPLSSVSGAHSKLLLRNIEFSRFKPQSMSYNGISKRQSPRSNNSHPTSPAFIRSRSHPATTLQHDSKHIDPVHTAPNQMLELESRGRSGRPSPPTPSRHVIEECANNGETRQHRKEILGAMTPGPEPIVDVKSEANTNKDNNTKMTDYQRLMAEPNMSKRSYIGKWLDTIDEAEPPAAFTTTNTANDRPAAPSQHQVLKSWLHKRKSITDVSTGLSGLSSVGPRPSHEILRVEMSSMRSSACLAEISNSERCYPDMAKQVYPAVGNSNVATPGHQTGYQSSASNRQDPAVDTIMAQAPINMNLDMLSPANNQLHPISLSTNPSHPGIRGLIRVQKLLEIHAKRLEFLSSAHRLEDEKWMRNRSQRKFREQALKWQIVAATTRSQQLMSAVEGNHDIDYTRAVHELNESFEPIEQLGETLCCVPGARRIKEKLHVEPIGKQHQQLFPPQWHLQQAQSQFQEKANKESNDGISPRTVNVEDYHDQELRFPKQPHPYESMDLDGELELPEQRADDELECDDSSDSSTSQSTSEGTSPLGRGTPDLGSVVPDVNKEDRDKSSGHMQMPARESQNQVNRQTSPSSGSTNHRAVLQLLQDAFNDPDAGLAEIHDALERFLKTDDHHDTEEIRVVRLVARQSLTFQNLLNLQAKQTQALLQQQNMRHRMELSSVTNNLKQTISYHGDSGNCTTSAGTTQVRVVLP